MANSTTHLQAKPLPPRDTLLELMEYIPETGRLFWKKRGDWKRVANIRAAHENAIACWDSEHGMTPGHGERAHADRAFLLSLLPKQETNDGQ